MNSPVQLRFKLGLQTEDFIATDILRARDGKVTDNWNLEYNLAVLKKFGVVPSK